MSLLLDALKKAAEQKARQAKADAGAGSSDDDRTETAQLKDDTIVSEDRTIEYGDRADETHTDDTEVSADPTQEVTLATQIDEDVTDVYEQDQTHRYRDKSEFNEDNTHLLEEDSTITGADAAADETFVNDVTDHTAITEINHEVEYDPLDNTVVDDTVLDSEDRTEYTETIIETPSHQGDRDVTIRSAPDEDETTPVDSDRDISDFMGDSIDDSTQSIDEDTDHTDDSLEDLSLLLVDNHDDTVHDSDNEPTTKSGPHFESGEVDTKLETTGLVDQDHKTVTQTASITADQNGNVPPGIELESLRHEHTIVRPEATSTHTYAPDNYDRTLIRPPSDDASRIFAGMKAEEDVLMTPDYAKRVFLSKYSANRMQHYKVYLGIAVSVFLAIGIFSMFELLDEYNEIDTAMLPLKRDPMPGIIRKDTTRDKGNILDTTVQPGVDMQTLKLVESAGTGAITEDTVNEKTEISTSSEPPAGSEDVQNQSEPETEAAIETIAIGPADEQVTAKLESTRQPIERVSAATQDAKTASIPSASLQISSSSRPDKIDQWLADGYAAYQNGDDETALKNYALVLEREPLNRNALLASAAIKVQKGDTSSAISNYQQLLLANPKDTLAMTSLISIARVAPQESESQLKLMIREEPDSPHLNFVLGNVYGAQNRWQEAQSLYFIALQNKPEDPNYAYNLAVSLEHIEKPEAAITYYERAIENIRNGLATFDKDLVDSRIEMLKQL